MSIRRRGDELAEPEKHPHIPISVDIGTKSLNHPEKTSAFASFFDR